ncbi:MAG: exodeoxyribonuclease V subunit gamma [Myxococcaceae bacterium]|nr:exodeoxyribonuclease V subunit gamma [Myxococcaceae bacterium]
MHWDQGLTRLALGAFMGGERSGPPGVVELPDGTRYVSEERTQSAQEGLGTLVTLTRSLLADARGLADACLTVPHWHALLVSYVTTYVQPDGDGDERALGAVLRALAGLLDRPFVETLPYTVVQRLALEALEGLSLDVGGHLAQGVVIGTPAALVGVPFRRVAFLGLEEGSFPALPGRSELDLRDAGDLERTDGRRRDTCDFFTLVHDTREHVCLAYLAFDPISGEARAPSSLIDDLRARHPRAQPPPAPVLLAAHRFEDLASGELGAAVAWAFPEARAEGAVAGLGAAWQARAGVEPALSDVEEGWRAFVGATLPTPATAAMESTLELRLDHLSLFLRCPAQGFARAVLGLRGDDDARDALIDEPFAHSALDEAVVFKEVLYRLVSEVPGAALASPAGSAKAIEALYDEVTRRRAGAGMAPVGYFARLQRRKDLEALVSASAALVADDARGPQPPGARLRWGPSASSAVGVLASRPPLALEVSIAGGARRVRLSGETGVLFADGAREVRFQRSAKTSVSGPWRAAIRWRELLTGWVSHLALQATGVRARRRSQVATPEGVAFETTFDDLDPAQAKQELGRIVETLMARRVGYRAPAVAFFADRAGLGPSVPWAQRIARFRELCDKVYLGQKAVERAHFAGLREIDALPEPGQAAFEAQFERLSFFLDRETPAVEQAALTRAAGKRKKS